MKTIPTLRIGELEAKIPIVQGGMSVGISLAGLASAVANEGGIGVIGAAGIGMLEPDFATNYRGTNRRALIKEIRKAKEMTDGIIAINIMVAATDFCDLVMDAVDEAVDIIFFGAGLLFRNPITLPPEELKKVATKLVPIVSSAKAVNIIFQRWSKNCDHVPDAVVVEGPMAGGHLGFKRERIDNPDYSLDKILPEVVSAVKPFEEQYHRSIPVIAAGGIYTGADIHKYLQMGAQGAQMATRFVATHECDASLEFKESYVNCKKEDLAIIESPVGLPGRAIQNKYLEDVSAGIRKPFKCPWKCLMTCDYKKAPYCIALALTNAKRGRFKNGFAFAGANAYRIDEIISVKELIKILTEEYKEAAGIPCSEETTAGS